MTGFPELKIIEAVGYLLSEQNVMPGVPLGTCTCGAVIGEWGAR